MKKNLSYIFATVFGVGYFPFASGTAGSALAVPFALAAAYFGGFTAVLAFAVFAYALGVFAVKEVLKYTKHDPQIVVIDEIVGQTVTFLPAANYMRGNINAGDLWIYASAFILFRLFDILKPWPANYFDKKIINAHGVMLDDVFAGIYAAAALWGLICIF